MPTIPARNRVGTVSLTIAASGFTALEAVHFWGQADGAGWTLARAGFEAAVIGGIADWFAVSALFRPIPCRLVALPHTDLVARNRNALTEGLVDLVENQILSPSSVRKQLQGFSISSVLLKQFDNPAARELAASTLTALAGHAASELEDDKLRGFLTGLLREQILNFQLAPLFAAWLEARLIAGDTRVLWQSVAEQLADQADRGEFDELINTLVQECLESYKEQLSGFAKIKGVIASAAIDVEKDGQRLRQGLTKTLREMAGADSHPLAKRLDEALAMYAVALRNGTGSAAQRIAQFQRSFADHPDLETVVRHMLTDLRKLAEAKLRNNPAEVDGMLAGIIERGIAKLRTDLDVQSRLDGWARETLGDVVAQHHGCIGSTARDSLNRLKDRDLVAELEARVGDDLQYIRLNGAVIGALVGVVLASSKLLLGTN